MTVERLQEAVYDPEFDYRFGSPHLSHYQLFERLADELRTTLAKVVRSQLPRTVLEIGAGDGGFTEPILASGYRVTATEVSASSIARLEEKYGGNPNFQAVYDPEGSLEAIGSTKFEAVVCVSVLHHIPEYKSFLLNAISEHLELGGHLFTAQDPLWYPSVPKSTRWITRIAYYSWRVTKGNYRRGIATFLRRLRGVYDDEKPGDVVEYHVVRDGVDHIALEQALAPLFEVVIVKGYWSSQSALWQRIGDRIGLRNSFSISAHGYVGSP